MIDALVGLVTFSQMRRYYRVDRWDWVFFTGAMAGILFFGILQGVLIGVVLSLLLLIARSSRTSVRPLGRDPASDTYHYIERHEGLERLRACSSCGSTGRSSSPTPTGSGRTCRSTSGTSACSQAWSSMPGPST